ncbi:ISAon1 family transposase [Candidatus Electrothrix sp.]|uniref:ISAon1 family transposase n=1 Tax=Candidatus Electrothrix sp. TaxID=2170559 RepID=UPI004056B204
MDTKPVSANSVGGYFQVDGNSLGKHYKEHLSGFRDWEQLGHADEWLLFPENIGTCLCLDEIALSDGELFTVLTNARAKCQKGSLIAIVKGIKSGEVCKILSQIPISKRQQVKEISVDMANSMEKIAYTSFPNASVVTDRFHVAKLISEAVQEIRINHRWKAIEQENIAIKEAKKSGIRYNAPVYENGDTKKQLLARSRYLLFKPTNKWTESQQLRAGILFKEYPDIKKAYELSLMFRNIYETSGSKSQACENLNKWNEKVKQYGFDSFATASASINSHKETILNFFVNRTTNALAESFNSKIKAFRSVFRGVRDIKFFLYRVSLIFA